MKRLPKYTPAEVRNDPYGFTYKEMSEVIGENEAKALYEELYNYKWANIEKCTKSVADRTLFTDIKLLYTFYCPYTADSIVQFFKFAHL